MRTRENAEQEETEKMEMRKSGSKTNSLNVPGHFRDTRHLTLSVDSTTPPIPTAGRWPPTTGVLKGSPEGGGQPQQPLPQELRGEKRGHTGQGDWLKGTGLVSSTQT